jgi:hypothetical protein
MNHFCRFLLKCGTKAGEKTAARFDANEDLTESQIRDDAASGQSRAKVADPRLEDGIYSYDGKEWSLDISTKVLRRECSRLHFAGVAPTTFANARVSAA